MTSESKILTVSYGTFSCTLEGFDDPFATMKVIAEYFRDLTAEDRYFGAVPPQPDAAMLHRIADREVSRLVGSKSRDAGLVLRPGDLVPSEGRVTGRPRTNRAPADQPAPPPEPPIVEPALQDVMPTGVVAKLARIRESVSRPLDETRPDDGVPAFDEEIDELPSAPDGVVIEGEAAVQSGDAASRIGALLQDPDAEADTAAEASDANIFSDLAGPDLAGFEPSGDRALAAVVEAEAEAEAPFMAAEDLLPEMLTSEMPTEDGGIFPEAGIAAYQDDPLPALDALAEAAAADAEFSAAAVVETPAEIEPAVAVVETPAEIEPAATVVETPAEIEPAAAVVETPAEIEPAAALSDPEAPLAEVAEAASDLVEEGEAEPETEARLPTPRSANRTRQISSRVVRIHPDTDVAGSAADESPTRKVLSDEANEVARLMRQADDVMADEENRRRLDSLAHLKAAVAATEADRAAGELVTPASARNADAYRDDLAQVVQPDPEPAPTEVKPRRKTVSVRPQEPRPGTIRPGMVSPPPLVLVSEQRIDRVASAPEAPLAPALAPAAKAPAPLPTGLIQPGIDGQPLVALRTGRLTGAIGIGAAAASPIMPHERVALNLAVPAASADMDDEDDLDEQLSNTVETGLASFAERVGVKSMAEMLEAAAAYATCVERREQFTRPQLMRRLMASAGGKPINREDGLRSFGTLLRTGRIEKVSRGHYILAEQSPYLAEARRFN